MVLIAGEWSCKLEEEKEYFNVPYYFGLESEILLYITDICINAYMYIHIYIDIHASVNVHKYTQRYLVESAQHEPECNRSETLQPKLCDNY